MIVNPAKTDELVDSLSKKLTGPVQKNGIVITDKQLLQCKQTNYKCLHSYFENLHTYTQKTRKYKLVHLCLKSILTFKLLMPESLDIVQWHSANLITTK